MAEVEKRQDVLLQDYIAGLPPAVGAGVDREFRRMAQRRSDAAAVRRIVVASPKPSSERLTNSEGAPSLTAPVEYPVEDRIIRSVRALRKHILSLGGELNFAITMPDGEVIRLDHLSLEEANRMRSRMSTEREL